MNPKGEPSLVQYGMVLALAFIALGAIVVWLAPLWGRLLALGLIAAVWGTLLYLTIVLVLVGSVGKGMGSNKLALSYVLGLRRHMLLIYSVLDLLVVSKKRSVELQRALIALNNQLLDAAGIQVKGTEILVLTPHCIQRSKCGVKVTGDENHCSECGMCTVGDLSRVQKQFGVSVAIATGGTLARQIIKAKRPKLVIAVACERDLVSGLRDASALPVYGIYNERPNGPCRDTQFDVTTLEKLLVTVIETKG